MSFTLAAFTRHLQGTLPIPVNRKLDRLSSDAQFLMCRNMRSDRTRKGALDVGDAYSYNVRASCLTAERDVLAGNGRKQLIDP